MTNKLQSKVGLTAGIVLYCVGIAGTTSPQSYVGIDLYLIQSPTGDPVYFPSGSGEIAAVGLVVGYPVNLSAPGGGGEARDGLLWTPPAGAVVDLTLMRGVTANATDGVHQVGARVMPCYGTAPRPSTVACRKCGAGDAKIAAINRQDACALHAAPAHWG